MKKINLLYVASIVFYLVALVGKQYWLLNQLNMQFSNQYHMYMSIGGTLLFLAPLLLLGTKKYYGFLISDLLLSSILFSDLLYYRYFGDFITIPVLAQSGQTIGIMDSIINLMQIGDIVLFLSIPFWIVLAIVNKKVEKTTTLFRNRLVSVGVVAIVGSLLFGLPIQNYIKEKGTALFAQSYSNSAIYRVLGIVGFHSFDIKKYIDENYLNKEKLTEKELSDIENWFTANNSKTKSEYYGVAKNKNLIVFQAESFQSFVLGKTIDGQEITPNLNKLLTESVYFNNVFDQTAQGRTSDAEILVNASLYPLKTGSVHVRYPSNTFDSLANNLDGYSSYSFHGNNKSFWNRYLIHSNLGFDKFYSLEELKDDERLGPFLSDGSLLKQTEEILSETKQPFYSFIVGVTSHHPFNFAKSVSTFKVGEYQGTMFGEYLQAVHYVDAEIGNFIEQLKQKGLWEDSIFVLYGDHNTGLLKGNNEIAEFLGMDVNSAEYKMEDLRIPLIMHLPNNIQGNTKINTVGGLIDVSPTLFHLMGKDKPNFMFGNDLFTNENGAVVFRNGGFINNEFYLDNTNGIPKCYNNNTGMIEDSSCKEIQKSLFERITLSDKVIKNNLIKSFKK